MIVFGIETSCDDTAVGIVDGNRNILANVAYSQIKEHTPHGGVVPEIAARAHVNVLDGLIRRAIEDAGIDLKDIAGVAATSGPGLIGGVMVGMMTGKAMAAALNKPFIGINHLEAHALTARLTEDVPFPYLVLLISGGHTQLLLAEDVGQHTILGQSMDDAAGEAFDKSAKLMGLPYPGGSQIEKWAKECANTDAARTKYPLPRPLMGQDGCDFSFSGLKTAMRQTVQNLPAGAIPTDTLIDLCAALQQAIGDILADRVHHAILRARTLAPALRHIVLAGGVAANFYLRGRVADVAGKNNMHLLAPPAKLCTDNGVMVAWAGVERLRLGKISTLDIPARPRWGLDELRETA